ncbi:MAG: DUF268 domain-containing protein [Bacteroidota bacterium]
MGSIRNHIAAFCDPVQMIRAIPRYWRFWCDYRRFKKLQSGKPKLKCKHTLPKIHEKSTQHGIDGHYLYQYHWGFSRIQSNKPSLHTDIGSQLNFVVGLTTMIPEVQFLEYRSLDIQIPNLKIVIGDILKLPFKDNSIESLSTFHVIEHIGLGRYGDPVMPDGHIKALEELQRVLAPEGNLYITVPVGQPRIEFNAHRVFHPEDMIHILKNLELTEFSIIKDGYVPEYFAEASAYETQKLALGLYHFTKK